MSLVLPVSENLIKPIEDYLQNGIKIIDSIKLKIESIVDLSNIKLEFARYIYSEFYFRK